MQAFAKVKFFIHVMLLTWCALFSLAANAESMPYDKIVVFGDSLSDVGNVYNLTGGKIPRNPPYYEGRFSDGPLWIEHLARALNLDPTSPDQFVDYAFAGSWAGDDISYNTKAIYKLSYEIEDYINERAEDLENEGKHLFVFWIGSNDYLLGDQNAPLDTATNDAIKSIKHNLEILVRDGALTFLILNITDLGNTPSSFEEGPATVERLTKISQLHNHRLATMLADLRHTYPNVKFIEMDIMPYFSDLMANPEKYRLKNVTTPCYDGDIGSLHEEPSESYIFNQTNPFSSVSPKKRSQLQNQVVASLPKPALRAVFHSQPTWTVCSNPNDYVYWDKLHPTGYVHRLLADFVIERLRQEGLA